MESPNTGEKDTVNGSDVTYAPPLKFTKDNVNDYNF